MKSRNSDLKVEKGTLGVFVGIDERAKTAEIKWCQGEAGVVRKVSQVKGQNVYSFQSGEEKFSYATQEFPGLYAPHNAEERYRQVCVEGNPYNTLPQARRGVRAERNQGRH